MFLLDTGSTICIQQTISGSGAVFDGTMMGYANYVYSNGGVSFSIRASQLGVPGNALQFAMAAVVDSAKTVVTFDGTTMILLLKRTTGTITATATEVVAAINDYFSRQISTNLGIVAGLITGGTIPAGLSAVALTGGLDPVMPNSSMLKFTGASTIHGGLFYFENNKPWYVSSVTARFASSAIAISVGIVNVDKALNQVSHEEVAVWEPTTVDNYAALEDMKTPVMPGQALIITAPSAGMVRVTARSESVWSYL